MSSNYDIEIYYRPGLSLSKDERDSLQADICSLGTEYLSPLPSYQVFDTENSNSLDDKVIVTIREDNDSNKNNLIAFVSAILIPMEGLKNPVLHTGVTIIHPQHRKSMVKRLLFVNLCATVLSQYPDGIWVTSLAEVITSLVHLARYMVGTFPAPQWAREQGSTRPTSQHLKIAREISANHRPKMCISPTAAFDEERFIFLGSNDWPAGRVFMKDVEDPTIWHRNTIETQFFKDFFRRGAGDEVLQVAFLDMSALSAFMTNERFAENEEKIISKASQLLAEQM